MQQSEQNIASHLAYKNYNKLPYTIQQQSIHSNLKMEKYWKSNMNFDVLADTLYVLYITLKAKSQKFFWKCQNPRILPPLWLILELFLQLKCCIVTNVATITKWIYLNIFTKWQPIIRYNNRNFSYPEATQAGRKITITRVPN